MTRWWLLLGLMGCEPTDSPVDTPVPDRPEAVCAPVSSSVVDAPWETIDAIGTSPDALTLAMLGEWRGQFEDAAGDYQPANLFLYPAEKAVERVEWASEEGPCYTEVIIPVDLFLDVPCLIYGDIATTVSVVEAGSGTLASAKIDAPRNLLDRPDFDAPLVARGQFEEGVMALQLVWEGEDEEQPAGQLSAALQ